MLTIGLELISSETVALAELVKNAYDADAHHVLIRLTGPLEEGAGVVEVLDGRVAGTRHSKSSATPDQRRRSSLPRRKRPRSIRCSQVGRASHFVHQT
jgi:hypothetical protein